jgi:hypothetical protein
LIYRHHTTIELIYTSLYPGLEHYIPLALN